VGGPFCDSYSDHPKMVCKDGSGTYSFFTNACPSGMSKAEVVDEAACQAAFPGTVVPIPPDGDDNDQTLSAGKIVFYQEATSSGTCDESNLPTSTAKSLTAAYGAYCHSDRGPICPANLDDGECPVDEVPGFDNMLRVCPVAVEEGGGLTLLSTSNGEHIHQHTGTQFATGVQLAGTVDENGNVPFGGGVAVLFQPVLNVQCARGHKNEGIHKVWIPNQERLAQADVDIGGGFDLSKAPKLHAAPPPAVVPDDLGVAPVKAVPNVLRDGVLTLELTYKKCDLADEIFDKLNPDPKNNSKVTLFLTGNIAAVMGDGGYLSGSNSFKSEFQLKVTGAKK
jgi:hypothetical protein